MSENNEKIIEALKNLTNSINFNNELISQLIQRQSRFETSISNTLQTLDQKLNHVTTNSKNLNQVPSKATFEIVNNEVYETINNSNEFILKQIRKLDKRIQKIEFKDLM